jgi:hypothetical protein
MAFVSAAALAATQARAQGTITTTVLPCQQAQEQLGEHLCQTLQDKHKQHGQPQEKRLQQKPLQPQSLEAQPGAGQQKPARAPESPQHRPPTVPEVSAAQTAPHEGTQLDLDSDVEKARPPMDKADPDQPPEAKPAAQQLPWPPEAPQPLQQQQQEPEKNSEARTEPPTGPAVQKQQQLRQTPQPPRSRPRPLFKAMPVRRVPVQLVPAKRPMSECKAPKARQPQEPRPPLPLPKAGRPWYDVDMQCPGQDDVPHMFMRAPQAYSAAPAAREWVGPHLTGAKPNPHTPSARSEKSPEAPAEAPPQAPPEPQPESLPKAPPEASPEASCKAVTEPAPKARPEASPEAQPEAWPKARSEASPKAQPEAPLEPAPKARPLRKASPKPAPKKPEVEASPGAPPNEAEQPQTAKARASCFAQSRQTYAEAMAEYQHELSKCNKVFARATQPPPSQPDIVAEMHNARAKLRSRWPNGKPKAPRPWHFPHDNSGAPTTTAKGSSSKSSRASKSYCAKTHQCPCGCTLRAASDPLDRPEELEHGRGARDDKHGRWFWTCCYICGDIVCWATEECPHKVWARVEATGRWRCEECWLSYWEDKRRKRAPAA